MFINEVNYNSSTKKLVDELEDYGFETDDGIMFDNYELADRFSATANIGTLEGYFTWDSNGNAEDVGKVYDLANATEKNNFLEVVHNMIEGYDTGDTLELYHDALESIGFTKTNDGNYKRVETNKFNNGVVETITAEFDFSGWNGEVSKEYNKDYDNEFEEFNNFWDWAEEAEIIN